MNFEKNNEKYLNQIINKKKYKKIFVISGYKSFKYSGIKKVINFNNKEKNFSYFFKESYLPNINELLRLTISISKINPDLVIAVGGGAVLDYAKIANIIDIKNLKRLKKKLINYETPGKKKNYTLIAIPTTAGSGAEVTSNAVIYINNVKYSVESKLLIPSYHILISSLILKNPLKLKASSGFDAIAQSLESLISMKSNNQSINFAKKSLILSNKNYLKFLDKPNFNNSTNMLLAANLSGKAINISKTTAPHAISYPFSSMYNIHHGHAVSLNIEKFFYLNYLLRNESKSKFDLTKRYEIIFNIFDVKNINEFVSKLKYIKRKAALIDNYKKLGINIESNISKILKEINLLRLKNNPIEYTKKDLKRIILDQDFKF